MVASNVYLLAVFASFIGAALSSVYNGVWGERSDFPDLKHWIQRGSEIEDMMNRKIPTVSVEDLTCESGPVVFPKLEVPTQVFREQSLKYHANPWVSGYTTKGYNCEGTKVVVEYFKPDEYRSAVDIQTANQYTQRQDISKRDFFLYVLINLNHPDVKLTLVVYEIKFNGDDTLDYYAQAYWQGQLIALTHIRGSINGAEILQPKFVTVQ